MSWDVVIDFAKILIIAVIILAIFFCFWTIVFIPVQKKRGIDKLVDEEQQELNEILIQKGCEWENYKNLIKENEKLSHEIMETRKLAEKLKLDVGKKEIKIDELKAKEKASKSKKTTTKEEEKDKK